LAAHCALSAMFLLYEEGTFVQNLAVLNKLVEWTAVRETICGNLYLFGLREILFLSVRVKSKNVEH